jgi:aspartyl-tRNA(Asn)/glutamyl-tRNA(Gln) amidotransferase subunit C
MRIIRGLIIHISTVTLTPATLDKLAKLSRLSLDPGKAEALRASLSDIVGWVGQLESAPVQGLAPMAHPHDLPLRLREDALEAFPEREVLMANAPEAAGGFFLVPRVVE